MGRTITRNTRREADGFIITRDPRKAPRRQATRADVVRAEIATDRPAVRAALKGATR